MKTRTQPQQAFWQRLATEIATGAPLLASLDTSIKQIKDKDLRTALADVRKAIAAGASFAEALATCPEQFAAPVVAAIRRSEAACDLTVALPRIAEAIGNDDIASLDRSEGDTAATTAGAEQPIIQMVGKIMLDAANDRASDIHFEPQEDGKLQVRFRIDGIMQPHKAFDAAFTGQMINRLKIMAGVNIAEKRLPQDGRIQIKVKGKALDLRVSLVPTVHGERITIRILNRDALESIHLDMLGMDAVELQRLRQTFESGAGIVLCSGPTGSGKTTVMYGMLKEIDAARNAIFTVEDPVEYILPGIAQIRLQPHIGLTWSAALRSILRQAPDVVMISEIRDFETLQHAVQFGLTGHRVLSQLHTNSAAAALTRLVEIGLEPFLVGETVKAVINQRLVRKLCVHCRKRVSLPVARLPKAVAEFAKSIAAAEFHEPVGCDQCGLGYRGRAAIIEVLFMSERLKEALCAKAGTARLHAIAMEDGMVPLIHDGIRKAAAGVTSIQEVMRIAASLA